MSDGEDEEEMGVGEGRTEAEAELEPALALTTPAKGHLQPPRERETWAKKVEFLLAVIGFAVDLGNVWRFPYICYQNGGGAFLIPYCIMLIFGGLPLFYMELALGQFHRCGCLTIWKRICPALKGVGYAICLMDVYMGMYYNTIIGWAVYYLFASFRSELPWTSCNNPWNTLNCTPIFETGHNTSVSPAKEFFERSVLEQDKSNGLDRIGPIKWSLAICVLAVFLLVYFSLWKGVRSTGKAVWVTALAPYVVLVILLVRGISLPGASEGIRYYLTPQWHKLKYSKVWIDAASQIFFSLGPGFGTLLALSSYNKFNNNCYRLTIKFFDSLDSTFGGLEAMITALCDEYPRVLGRNREIFVAVLLVAIYFCALPTTTYGGVYLVNLLNVYGPGLAILFVVFVEAAGVCWVYGVNRFSSDIETMLGHRPGLFWRICWAYISPIFLLVIFVFSLMGYEEMLAGDYVYPSWSISVGWLLTASSLTCIPAYILYKFCITPGSFSKRLSIIMKPEEISETTAINASYGTGTHV
ncbi:sodium-dependent serotonin transporter [Nilaparvata lugens]|uniref:sodium-dependent serotonin transporter n=1 Tax=Nilaparvata lugens TaxID=108931 RepID=UPI00193D572F|nr:sodium-dependent serotonin transporter [Nilaparvata lugens]